MSIFTRVGWYPVVLACDDHLPTHTAVTPLTCTYTQQFQFISHNKYCTNHNFSAIINCLCRSFWLSESFRWVLIIPFSVAMAFCTLLTCVALTFPYCAYFFSIVFFILYELHWDFSLVLISHYCIDLSVLFWLSFMYCTNFSALCWHLCTVMTFLHYDIVSHRQAFYRSPMTSTYWSYERWPCHPHPIPECSSLPGVFPSCHAERSVLVYCIQAFLVHLHYLKKTTTLYSIDDRFERQERDKNNTLK